MDFFTLCKNKTEAKSVFRKLSKCFHPDKGGQNDLMVELQKQFDAWTPKPKESIQTQENPYAKFSFEVNPRVQILEQELAKLRKQLENPRAESEISRLKSYTDRLNNECSAMAINLLSKNQEIEKLTKEKAAAVLEKMDLEEKMQDIKEQLLELKEMIHDGPKEVELTLWEKIKYVFGDKSINRYN